MNAPKQLHEIDMTTEHDPRVSSGSSNMNGRSIVDRMRALLRAADEGQALVESAIALSLFLMVVMGIFSFGIVFYQYLTLTSAVGSGAQNLQQIASTTSDPCADTLAAIQQSAPNLSASSIGLTVTTNGTAYTGSTCPSVTPTSKTSVTVSATYPCSYKIINFIYSNCQLSASSTEYVY